MLHDNHTPNSLRGRVVAGRFLVERRLRTDLYSDVYLAEQIPMQRHVVLQILSPPHSTNPDAVAAFEKEVRAVSKIAHPNIVSIFDFGVTDQGEMFVASEYSDDLTLRDVLQKEGSLPWPRTIGIIKGIASGLAEIHRRSLVHFDIRPENIALSHVGIERDFPKILNFAMSKISDMSQSHDAIYFSPERILQLSPASVETSPYFQQPTLLQQLSKATIDGRSDLYALGILWFEMLVGNPPFTENASDTNLDIRAQHLYETPPHPQKYRPQLKIPVEIEHILLSLLAKNPDSRPASAHALLARLGDIVAPQNWQIRSVEQLSHDAEKTADLRRLRRALFEIPSVNFAHALNISALDDDEPLYASQESSDTIRVMRGALSTEPAGYAPAIPVAILPGMSPADAVPLVRKKRKSLTKPDPDDEITVPPQIIAQTSPPPLNDDSQTQRNALQEDELTPRILHRPPLLLHKRKQTQQSIAPLTLAHAATLLARANSMHDVIHICWSYISSRFDRMLIVNNTHKISPVMASSGYGSVEGDAINAFALQVRDLWQHLVSDGPYYGPTPLSPAFAALYRLIDASQIPGAIFVATLRSHASVGDLFYIYAEQQRSQLRTDVKDLLMLLREASFALAALPH